MKIYCFYGIGTPTERSYYYAVTDESLEEHCSGNVNGTGCTHENQHEHQAKETSTAETSYSVRYPSLVITREN